MMSKRILYLFEDTPWGLVYFITAVVSWVVDVPVFVKIPLALVAVVYVVALIDSMDR